MDPTTLLIIIILVLLIFGDSVSAQALSRH